MDSAVVSQKKEEIRVALDALCKSVAKNKALCEKIKNRGFWERLFANNTRDLANAGTEQVELIEKLHFVVKELKEITSDTQERQDKMYDYISFIIKILKNKVFGA